MNTFIYYCAKILGIFLFKIFFLLEVIGKENIPVKGGFIIASNHSSGLDPVVLGVSIPRPLYYFAKSTLFKKNIFFRFLITSLGAISVEREEAPFSLREGLKVLKEKKGIVIFPEGTRSKNGSIGMGKPGIGFLAIKSKCPIIPVFISGTYKSLPYNKRIMKPQKIKVIIGKPIFFSYGNYDSISYKIIELIKCLKK